MHDLSEPSSYAARAIFDPEDSDQPVVAIATALAAVEGLPPSELPPLYDAIDTTALDRLFSTAADVDRPLVVSFEYDDWVVRVSADGQVVVTDGS